MDRINGFLQSEDIRTRALSTRRGPSSVGTKAVRGQSPARLSNVSNVSFNPAPAISITGRGSATTATGRGLSPSRPHSSRSNAMANSGNRR